MLLSMWADEEVLNTSELVVESNVGIVKICTGFSEAWTTGQVACLIRGG